MTMFLMRKGRNPTCTGGSIGSIVRGGSDPRYSVQGEARKLHNGLGRCSNGQYRDYLPDRGRDWLELASPSALKSGPGSPTGACMASQNTVAAAALNGNLMHGLPCAQPILVSPVPILNPPSVQLLSCTKLPRP